MFSRILLKKTKLYGVLGIDVVTNNNNNNNNYYYYYYYHYSDLLLRSIYVE
jgi:hypothetical protein